MATYVTICASCLYEGYFPKQARANSARDAHARVNFGHEVRVARVRVSAYAMSTLGGPEERMAAVHSREPRP
jgi:hypothetical protein